MGWLLTKQLGLHRALWIVMAIVALGGIWLFLSEREDADDKRNQEIGGTIEREASQSEIIKNVEKANEARDEIRNDDGDARYNQCLRTARTPAVCERLLRE